MKILQYFLFLSAFALVVSACEKNYDVTEIVTTEENSKELPTARITGQVRNMKNETVSSAIVHVLHNLSVHDVYTDEDGWYEVNLPLDHSTVRLQAEAGSYSNANIVIQHLLEDDLVQDLYLAQAGDMPFDYQNSTVITDSLRTISGFIEYADGNPVVGELIFLIDYSLYDISTYAISDKNGYFSIAVKPFQDKTLIVTGACSDLEPIIEDFSISNENLDLGTLILEYPVSDNVVFEGLITDCNTNKPLPFGKVSVTIGEKTVKGAIVSGEYSVVIPNCMGLTCYDLLIESPLLVDGAIQLSCEDFSGLEVKKDYELCGDPIVYDGSIDLEIDGVSFYYSNVIATVEGANWKVQAYDEQNFEQIEFLFSSQGLGEHEVISFGISDLNAQPIFSLITDESKLQAEIIENTVNLAGYMSGYVLDNTSVQVPISGSFQIKI